MMKQPKACNFIKKETYIYIYFTHCCFVCKPQWLGDEGDEALILDSSRRLKIKFKYF